MKGKNSPIFIGTRGSELALWQANFTKRVLEKNGLLVELKIIQTKGDATQQWNLSFDKIEGKGFFTKELEDALLSEEIDLAVHSCKDLPTDFPDGLTIAAYSKRANPFDLLLIKKESVDETQILKIKKNALVGTSSARRKSQLLALRQDIKLMDLRGNVPTRIRKLKEQNYDAILLASAGVERLQINTDDFTTIELKAPMYIPAPAQGVLAFQIRENDEALKNICALLNDEDTAKITNIERQLLHDFEGGCQMPLGVYAEKEEDKINIWIAQAKSWDAFPKRIHHSLAETILNTENNINELKNFSKKIVAQFKKDVKKAVFISSDYKDNDYLVQALTAHDFKVNCVSFIEFSPVPFEFPDKTDWLFFSSKNGVNYFFNAIQANSIYSTCRIAAINQGTANAIFALGHNVDFIGNGGDLQEIANAFDGIANGKIVFPQAKKSMQTIQKNLTLNREVVALVVYENKPKLDIKKRNESILVFTSPMNATAYFSIHKKEEHQIVISIGTTTTKKLEAHGITAVITAYEPTQWSLADKVFSCLG